MMRVAFLSLALVASAATAAPGCDTACLTKLAGDTAAALARRGASARLPWAPRVRYAENGVPMMVDDGIWATVTEVGGKPLVVADPATGQTLWMGMVAEHGQSSFLAMRLRAEGARIAEVEQVVRRQQGRPPFADPAAIDFAAGLSSPPSGARTSRQRIEAALRGWVAALASKGSPPQVAADCRRTENGVPTPCIPTPSGALEQVRGLTIVAVDEARGLVAATGTRDYPARPGTLGPDDARFPHSLAFAVVARVAGGAITHIQEVSSPVPYLMPTWQPAR